MINALFKYILIADDWYIISNKYYTYRLMQFLIGFRKKECER